MQLRSASTSTDGGFGGYVDPLAQHYELVARGRTVTSSSSRWSWIVHMMCCPGASGSVDSARLQLSASDNNHRKLAPSGDTSDISSGHLVSSSQHHQPTTGQRRPNAAAQRRAPRNNSTVSSATSTSSEGDGSEGDQHEDDEDDNVTVVSHSTLHDANDDDSDDNDASEERGANRGLPRWMWLQPPPSQSTSSLKPQLPVVLATLEAVGVCSGIGVVTLGVLSLSAAIAGWVAIVVSAVVHVGVWYLWQYLMTMPSSSLSSGEQQLSLLQRGIILRLQQLEGMDKHRCHGHVDQTGSFSHRPIGEQARSVRLLFACWDTLISNTWLVAPRGASLLSDHTNWWSGALEALRTIVVRGVLWGIVVLLYVASGVLLLGVGVIATASSAQTVKTFLSFSSSSGVALATQFLDVPVSGGSDTVRIATTMLLQKDHAAATSSSAPPPPPSHCGIVPGWWLMSATCAFAVVLVAGRLLPASTDDAADRRRRYRQRFPGHVVGALRFRDAVMDVVRFAVGFWDTGLFHVTSTMLACLVALAVLIVSTRSSTFSTPNTFPSYSHIDSSNIDATQHLLGGEQRVVIDGVAPTKTAAVLSTITTSMSSTISPSALADIATKLHLAFGQGDDDSNMSNDTVWIVLWAGVLFGGAIWSALAASTFAIIWYSQFTVRRASIIAAAAALRETSLAGNQHLPHGASRHSTGSSPRHHTSPHLSPTASLTNRSGKTINATKQNNWATTWSVVAVGCVGSFLAAVILALVVTTATTMTNFHEADNTMQPRSFVGAIINVTDSERQHPPLHPHVTPSSSSTNLFMMQRFLPLPLSLLWLEAPEWISRALMDATEDQHQHRHPALVSACYLPAFATLLQGSSSQTATSMSPSVSVFSRETTSWYLFSAWVVLLFGVVAMYHALHWFHVAISLVQWSVERDASVGLSDDGGGGASVVKAPRCHTLPHPDDLRDVYDDVWIGRYIRKLRSVTSADSPVTVQTTNHWRRRRRQSGARARASTSIRKWLRKVANGVKRCGSVLQKVARGLFRRVSCCCGGQEGDTQFSSSTDQHTRIIVSSNPRSSTRQSNPAAIGTQSFSNANDVLYSSQHHHQRRTYSNPIVVGTRRSLKIFNAVGSRSSAAAGSAGMRGDDGLGSPLQRNSFFSSTIPHVVDPTVRVAIKMFHDAPAINSLLLHRATTSRVYAALVGLGLLVSAIGLIFFALLRDNNNASLNSVSFDLHMTPSLLQRCSSWLIGVGGAVGVPCFLGIAITGCVGFRVQRQGRSQLLGLPRSSINSEEFHRHIVQDFDALMRSSYTVHRTTVPANLESQHRRPTKAPQQQQQDSEEKRTSDLRNTDYFAKMMKHHKGEPAQLVSTAGSAASASAVASSQRRKSQRLMETEQLLQGVSRSSGHSTRQQKNFVVTGPITVLMRKCLCVLGAAVGVAVVGCCVVSGIKIAL